MIKVSRKYLFIRMPQMLTQARRIKIAPVMMSRWERVTTQTMKV